MYLNSSTCEFRLTSGGYFGDHERPKAAPFRARSSAAVNYVLPPADLADPSRTDDSGHSDSSGRAVFRVF